MSGLVPLLLFLLYLLTGQLYVPAVAQVPANQCYIGELATTVRCDSTKP